MKITVKLFAHFREGRFVVEERDYPSGTTIAEVARDLGIAPGEVGITMMQGRHVPLAQVLQEGDVLALFPLVGGG